jgi:hypothetical protein
MLDNWKQGEPLPQWQNAEIDPRKFEQYSLNPNNPANQGKWKAFVQIGYDLNTIEDRQNATQDIINQLKKQLGNTPAIPQDETAYGLKFEVRVIITGLNGKQGNLFTGWQIDKGKNNPRLITNWLEVYR